ncbi:MAG: hypothetical protein R8G34_15480 [Paracoccaceae bacterium]|nr:hypothetical protein [Paracoccaceae bacterium]
MDIETNDDLEASYDTICREWAAEVDALLPDLQDWWDALSDNLDKTRPGLVNVHWPAGIGSHPRILGLFRMYYFRLLELNDSIVHLYHPPEHEDGERWGDVAREEGMDPTAPDPVSPIVLLIDDLPSYSESAAEALRKVRFFPIGMNAQRDLE